METLEEEEEGFGISETLFRFVLLMLLPRLFVIGSGLINILLFLELDAIFELLTSLLFRRASDLDGLW